MKSSRILFCLLLLTIFVYVGNAAAPSLTFTFKDVNVTGATETDTYAINDNGVITGDYIDSSGVVHGLILKGRKVTTIDDPNGTLTQGFGINSKVVVVGWYVNTSGVEVGFKWAAGTFTDIAPVSGALLTNATGINDPGRIVGTYVDSSGVQHGFLLVGKKLTTLDAPGVVATVAWGINNKNLITVYGVDSSGNFHSFTTTDAGKTYKPFAYPKAGALGTVIHTPNNAGDIVGTYFDSSSGTHGVLFHKGKYFAFDDPKASNSTRGDGINDSLHIVGRYSPSTGGSVGFEATVK